MILSSALLNCSDISDKEDVILEMTFQSSYLVPLAIASLLLLLKLKRQFTFGDLKKVIKRFYVLELMIQIMIWGRLGFSFYNFRKIQT